MTTLPSFCGSRSQIFSLSAILVPMVGSLEENGFLNKILASLVSMKRELKEKEDGGKMSSIT